MLRLTKRAQEVRQQEMERELNQSLAEGKAEPARIRLQGAWIALRRKEWGK